MSFSPSVGLTVGAATVTPTQITVPVNIPSNAALGPLDITVKNTDSSTATLPQSFEVKLNSALDVALSLECVSGCPAGVAVGQQVTPAAFLPTLDSVQVSLDTLGEVQRQEHHAHDLSAQGERHGYGYAAGLADLQADLVEPPRDVDQRRLRAEPRAGPGPAGGVRL